MFNKSLILTLLEAPAGYGKTYYLNNLLPNIYHENTLLIDLHEFIHKPELFFVELKNICLRNNLPYCNSLIAYDWYQVWQGSDSFTFIIDNYHLVSNLINDFISFFIYKSLENIQFIISSRQKIDLPFENLFAQDKALYLDLNSLRLSLNQTKKIWSDNKLEWSDKDEEFYNYYGGWNKGIFLYLQKQKNIIKTELFNQLIENSIKEVTEQYINEPVNKIINEIDILPDVFQNKIKLLYQNKVEYWLHLAQEKKLNPETAQIFLERALNISYSNNDFENIINISSKLGRSYSLSSDFSKVDLVLSNSEQFVDLTKSENKISWYYLKANRLRQLCQHDQAIELAKKILNVKSNTNIGLHLQTKAMVLIGLTEYQQGNYEETRKYYNKVLLLSDSENNFSLNIEVNIMLAFLDRWEGKENIILPNNILELINNQPLKAQPIMLLNLAFYGLLGEKVDLELAIKILSKIKDVSKILQWKYLIPLIADIEARIFRFKKDYHNAHICHTQALSNLEKESFEYLHAQLNYALTILRQGKNNDAQACLRELLIKANSSKSDGLIREINVLINQISPTDSSLLSIKNTIINNNIEKITIKMFDGFQIKVGDRVINKWSRKKAKHLLIYLLLNPKGIHRETLAELIFSSDTLDNPLSNLDVSIHSLRKVLEPERKNKNSSFILFQDSCYSFNWSYPYDCDVINFENNYKQWQKSNIQKEKYQFAQIALKNYSGLLLPDLDFSDNWISEREHLKNNANKLFDFLIKYLLDLKNDKAEYWIEKLINIDPLDEKGYLYFLSYANITKNISLLKSIKLKLTTILKKELDESTSSQFNHYYDSLEKTMINE